jgi:hypothetical protein
MANPQMSVKLVSSGAQLKAQIVGSDDSSAWSLGDDGDVVFFLRSTALAADTALTGVIVADSATDHQGVGVDSLIVSNITDDGDMMFLVNDNGDSKEFLYANGGDADLQIGHGMATATLKTASGVLTLDSGAAINIEPASGSAILLDGTISVDAGVVTGVTALTSATIDATTDFTVGDTIITDGVITDSSGLKFTANVHFGADGTDQDVTFYGDTSGRDMYWDAGSAALKVLDNTQMFFGTNTDLAIYHGSSVSYITASNHPLNINLNGGDITNVGDMEIDASKTITGSGDLTIDTVGNLNLDGGNDTVLMNSGATICIVDDVGLRLNSDTAHGTTAGTNIISLFEGTPPEGTLTNGASIYCQNGVMKVINEDGSGGTIDFS